VNPRAAYEAAHALLASETPKAVGEGLEMLAHAASRGSPQALTLQAHFAASGFACKPDWDRSVALLQEAAAAGGQPARDELAVLAGADGRVDIRALIAARQTELIREAPRMGVLRAFLSHDECAWIVRQGAPRLERALVYDPEKQGAQQVDARSNSGAPFRPLEVDTVLVFIHARIANSIGLPSTCFEPTYLLHYAPGQQFAPHHDYLDTSQPGLAEEMSQRGQRVATFLIYLNDDYEGGETDFPLLQFRHRGQTGDAFVFANVDPALTPDPRTLHAGLPPTRGEKWLLSQWVRNRPAA
jgi:predicted 2-oxoglutarate/Fe(II)-dependent dioxygenase YbiX